MKGPHWLLAIALALTTAATWVALAGTGARKDAGFRVFTFDKPTDALGPRDTAQDVARTAVSSRPSALPAALPVVVVRHSDGTPVPDVDVFALACDRKELVGPERAWFDLHWSRGDVETIARRFGSKHRTDSQGIATVPGSPRLTHLAARSGDLSACVSTSSLRERPLRLELEARTNLVVEAVDRSGRAWFGVEFRLEWGSDHDLHAEQLAPLDDPSMHLRLGFHEWLKRNPAVHTARIVGDAPLVPKLSHAFDPHALPTNPTLRLRLPPFGRVVVRIGRTYEATKLDYVVLEALWPDGRTTQESRYLVEGRAEFPLVGIGVRLRAGAELDRDSVLPFEFVGPAQEDQLVEITLR